MVWSKKYYIGVGKTKISACHSLLFHGRGNAEQTTLDNSELKIAGLPQLPNRKTLPNEKTICRQQQGRKGIMRIVGWEGRGRRGVGETLFCLISFSKETKHTNTKLSCWPRLYQASQNKMDRAAEFRRLHQYTSFPKFLVAEQLLVASSWNCFLEEL